MTSHDFYLWLDGYVTASQSTPTPSQWAEIKRRLALVNDREPALRQPIIRWGPSHPDTHDFTVTCGVLPNDVVMNGRDC